MNQVLGRFLLTSSTTLRITVSCEASQIKGKLRVIRMSLCGLPALRTFLRCDPLAENGCTTTGPFTTRVNREKHWWPGSDLRPNKKCIPRLLTPIMGGKNSLLFAPLWLLSPWLPSGRGSRTPRRRWRGWCGTLVTASPHPIFHR